MAMASTGVGELFDLSRHILDRGKQLLSIAQQLNGPEREQLLNISEDLLNDARRLSSVATELGGSSSAKRW